MKVLLAVGGGIAAYKSAELARLLMQQGHQVQVVMTTAAEEFVRPLTFAALTGRKVLTNLFAIESAIEHISVAQEHELLVIAPATADLMAKLAHGLADDFLTTLYLAFTGPVLTRACDERQHVAAPGHPGQPGHAGEARAQHRRTGQRISGLRNDRARDAWPTRKSSPRRSSAPPIRAAIWRAKPC